MEIVETVQNYCPDSSRVFCQNLYKGEGYKRFSQTYVNNNKERIHKPSFMVTWVDLDLK